MNNHTLTVKEVTIPLITHHFKTEEGKTRFTVYSDGRWRCQDGKATLDHSVYEFWEMLSNKNPYVFESELLQTKQAITDFLNGRFTLNQLKEYSSQPTKF